MAQENAKGPVFEWWMSSNMAVGAGFSAFVALLIPPFVTGATGNAADAGMVMAINWMAAIGAGLAVVLIVVSLLPAYRKLQPEEAAV